MLRTALGLALGMVLVSGVAAQLEGDNQVEAVVNDKVITRYDILQGIKKDGIQFEELPESERRLLFEQRLRDKVLEILRLEATKKAGVQLSPEALEENKQRYIESIGTRAAFQDFLRQKGLTEQEFNDQFRRDQEAAAWLSVVSGVGVRGGRLNRTFRPRFDLTVTPRELREYYRKHKDDEFTLKDEAVVRVIQIYFNRNRRGDRARKRQLMLGLKQKLATRADFAVLAKKHSEHVSKDAGGLIGKVEKGKGDLLVEPVEKAVFGPEARPGDVLGPIEFVNAFWLVRVEAKTEARVVPFEEAQQLIRLEIQQEKRAKATRRVLLELVKQAYVSPPRLKRRIETELRLR